MHDILMQFAELSTYCKRELLRQSSRREDESDEEADNESPIFDSFYSSGGSEAVMKIINFTQPGSANCTT